MKDPDITAPYLFLFGKVIPEKWGRRRLGIMPYRIQHLYFFFRTLHYFTSNIPTFHPHSWTTSASPYLLPSGGALLHIQKETSKGL